jgi:hypothetical protein
VRRIFRLGGLALVGVLLAAPGHASVILAPDVFISGDAVLGPPIAQLTFTDAGTDRVSVEIQSLFTDPACPSGRTCYGNLLEVLFNVNPSFLTPIDLTGSGPFAMTKVGSFGPAILGAAGQNDVGASGWPGGSGWDFVVSFPDLDFDAGESVSFVLSAPGLVENSFNVSQADGYSAMALVTQCISQDTAGYGCLNANYADTNGGSTPGTTVPESSSLLLLVSGLIAVTVGRCFAASRL